MHYNVITHALVHSIFIVNYNRIQFCGERGEVDKWINLNNYAVPSAGINIS